MSARECTGATGRPYDAMGACEARDCPVHGKRYTPGPWKARGRFLPHPNESLFVETTEAEPKTICNIISDSTHAHGDAALISAAPELLEACKAALAWFVDEARASHDDEHGPFDETKLGTLPAALRAAIRKAEGREP